MKGGDKGKEIKKKQRMTIAFEAKKRREKNEERGTIEEACLLRTKGELNRKNHFFPLEAIHAFPEGWGYMRQAKSAQGQLVFMRTNCVLYHLHPVRPIYSEPSSGRGKGRLFGAELLSSLRQGMFIPSSISRRGKKTGLPCHESKNRIVKLV